MTKNELIENVKETIKTLQQLRAMGLEISVDDFCAGYSSLSYLRRYQIDTLKIDRSLVCDIRDNPDNTAIVSVILAMTWLEDTNVRRGRGN
ncbi:EAL domain-containing protein [Nitrosomonas supralitoralis]|uniref:EAL domain-containing protein n=1 Tax=Nitrosomonas supralitoralis TaxID=2116706 RepID=A0A2P7NU10_9PROT|nr:EAL domain-containing protein [Nitrosomonas supralitoralis]PSJ16962.1 hypothetical protein C7H79_10705 [Nitrosomonas supralitoralis]